MYYIYHIPGVKIGCTQNPKNRIKQQTKGEFEILETYKNKFVAAKRELVLQKQYGYEVDTCDYVKSTSNLNPLAPSIAGKASATKQWKENRDKELIKCSMGGIANSEKSSRAVIMCDMNGNPIRQFKNRAEAADFVNGYKPPLVQSIDKPNRSYKGYKWINP